MSVLCMLMPMIILQFMLESLWWYCLGRFDSLRAISYWFSSVVMTLTCPLSPPPPPQVLWEVSVNHRKCSHFRIRENVIEIFRLIEQFCAQKKHGKLFYSSYCCPQSRTSFHFLINDLTQCPLTVLVLRYHSSVQHITHAARIPPACTNQGCSL